MFLFYRHMISFPFDLYSGKYVVLLCVLFKIVAKCISPPPPGPSFPYHSIDGSVEIQNSDFCTRRYSLVSYRPARWPEGNGGGFLRMLIWIQYLGEGWGSDWCADLNLKACAVAGRGRSGQPCSTSLLSIRDVTSAGEGLERRCSLCREQEIQRCVRS